MIVRLRYLLNAPGEIIGFTYMSTFGSDPKQLFVSVEGHGRDTHLLVLVDAVADDAVQQLELVRREIRLWKQNRSNQNVNGQFLNKILCNFSK